MEGECVHVFEEFSTVGQQRCFLLGTEKHWMPGLLPQMSWPCWSDVSSLFSSWSMTSSKSSSQSVSSEGQDALEDIEDASEDT